MRWKAVRSIAEAQGGCPACKDGCGEGAPQASISERGGRIFHEVMLVVGLTSVWMAFQRSFFILQLSVLDPSLKPTSLLYIGLGLLLASAVLVVWGRVVAVDYHRRRFLAWILCAFSLALAAAVALSVFFSGTALEVLLRPFGALTGIAAVFALYLWGMELMRTAYAESLGKMTIEFFAAAFLARITYALFGQGAYGEALTLFACPLSLVLWLGSSVRFDVEPKVLGTFEIAQHDKRYLLTVLLLILSMPASHILLIGTPSFVELSDANYPREFVLLLAASYVASVTYIRERGWMSPRMAQLLWFAFFGLMIGLVVGLLLGVESDASLGRILVNLTSTLWSLAFMLLFFTLILFAYESSCPLRLVLTCFFFIPQGVDIVAKYFWFTSDALPLLNLTPDDLRITSLGLVLIVLAALVSLMLLFGTSDAMKTLVGLERRDDRLSEGAGSARERRIVQLKGEFKLTDRECDILLYLSQGHSAARIGELLFISTMTVQTHVKHIYQKLNIHSRQEVVDLFSIEN